MMWKLFSIFFSSLLVAQTARQQPTQQLILDGINQLDKKIDKKIEQIEKRFEQIDKKFEQIDKRFQPDARQV